VKRQYPISLALLGLMNHAAAQSVAEMRTYDGSVQVQRDPDATSRDRALPPAPIAIVNAGKEGATAWAKGSTGQTTLKAISGTQDRNSTLNPSGDIDQAGSYAAMPAVAIRTGAVTQWVARSSSCSAHYTGQITWEAEQRKTVVAPAWADTGAIRNHKDECTPVVDTTWVSESASCASGYSGSKTWEAEQSSTAGGPYVATGNVRNVVNTCALIVVEPAPTPTPEPTPTPTPTPTPEPTPTPTPTPTPDPGDTGGGNGGNAPITPPETGPIGCSCPAGMTPIYGMTKPGWAPPLIGCKTREGLVTEAQCGS